MIFNLQFGEVVVVHEYNTSSIRCFLIIYDYWSGHSVLGDLVMTWVMTGVTLALILQRTPLDSRLLVSGRHTKII